LNADQTGYQDLRRLFLVTQLHHLNLSFLASHSCAFVLYSPLTNNIINPVYPGNPENLRAIFFQLPSAFSL